MEKTPCLRSHGNIVVDVVGVTVPNWVGLGTPRPNGPSTDLTGPLYYGHPLNKKVFFPNWLLLVFCFPSIKVREEGLVGDLQRFWVTVECIPENSLQRTQSRWANHKKTKDKKKIYFDTGINI